MADRQKLEDLLEYVKMDSRVCPMPVPWDALWQQLPERQRVGVSWEPYPPLILAGWWSSSDADKQDRLAYHILWAFDRDAFDVVDRRLRDLTINDWHHSDPSKPHF